LTSKVVAKVTFDVLITEKPCKKRAIIDDCESAGKFINNNKELRKLGGNTTSIYNIIKI